MLSNKTRDNTLNTRHCCCACIIWRNAWSETDVYQFENPTGSSEIIFTVLIHSSPLQMYESYSSEAKEMKEGLDQQYGGQQRITLVNLVVQEFMRSLWLLFFVFLLWSNFPCSLPPLSCYLFSGNTDLLHWKIKRVSSSKKDSSMWKDFSCIWVHIL